MRIIAGEFKGRPIAAPKGQGTRPTGDRAREAVFNLIAHATWAPSIEGARVVDLFAGSGALGLEAMSRGAAFCLFVETDSAARGAIRDNCETLGLFGTTRIHRRSATDLGPKPANLGAPFTLAFLDPPYHKALPEPALASLVTGGWLTQDALAVVETAADETPTFDGWTLLDARTYGAARVWFLTRA
ncbi:16S rRNA (guanine(966)-N(2))-methyltransferase RsmD [Hyphomonas johnsonii]|uniref:Putative methyltransferase n=1 Tax=Hyphomonas johnsonii MHS-2 TaxID=1280950 RepID=A0A059FJR2_9PROT|nr:16S rRNA (guanine(966)-N(2))-methyltransferase RsmD [Hyphomonas johnsonii]KCZ90847.1 putative methyltransferase [Hyphomonas johnsonii MHS-2]